MLRRFFAGEPRTTMPLNTVGEVFEMQPSQGEADLTFDVPFSCLFEPIYKRQHGGFGPAGHKIISRLIMDERAGTYQPFHDHRPPSDLARAIEYGVPQIDIITAQIDHFLRYKEHEEQQKLVFEIDMSDFESYQVQHQQLRNLVAETAWSGLEPADFVIELPASQCTDPGDLYTVARDLKELGVMIALTELDADAFSYKRIFQVAPHIIKLNGSWFEQSLEDPQYLTTTSSIIAGFSAKGLFVAMTGISTPNHARFAYQCGVSRAQGSFFGEPTEWITRGQSIML